MRAHRQPERTDQLSRARPGAHRAEEPRRGLRSAGQILAPQRTVGNAAVTSSLDDGSIQQVLRTAGRPLDPPVRQEMEDRMGADFSNVRLHTGPAARRSAAGVGARAYTSDSHVVIGAAGAGRHTLAHELTHVSQQRSGPVPGTDTGSGLRISDPADPYEREAEANARRVRSGSEPTRRTERPPADEPSANTALGHSGVRSGAAAPRRSAR
ncbi:MAG TPA: DUF4157 domain-containing protein [Mycobacteriales bacterium]|nr:DUF4157 domain-containing protein [Mycobacteriales bacterium]